MAGNCLTRFLEWSRRPFPPEDVEAHEPVSKMRAWLAKGFVLPWKLASPPLCDGCVSTHPWILGALQCVGFLQHVLFSVHWIWNEIQVSHDGPYEARKSHCYFKMNQWSGFQTLWYLARKWMKMWSERLQDCPEKCQQNSPLKGLSNYISPNARQFTPAIAAGSEKKRCVPNISQHIRVPGLQLNHNEPSHARHCKTYVFRVKSITWCWGLCCQVNPHSNSPDFSCWCKHCAYVDFVAITTTYLDPSWNERDSQRRFSPSHSWKRQFSTERTFLVWNDWKFCLFSKRQKFYIVGIPRYIYII